MLMAPKPNRLLESENQLVMTEGEAPARPATGKEMGNVKGKKSFRRLSDILKHGEKQDLWVVYVPSSPFRYQGL